MSEYMVFHLVDDFLILEAENSEEIETKELNLCVKCFMHKNI